MMFVLKLKEKHKLAQTTVDDILADTEELLGRAIERLKQRVSTLLNEAGVDPKEVPNFMEAFGDSEITQTFNGLKTEHLQTKFYRENMGLVVSNVPASANFGFQIASYRGKMLSTFAQLSCYILLCGYQFNVPLPPRSGYVGQRW